MFLRILTTVHEKCQSSYENIYVAESSYSSAYTNFEKEIPLRFMLITAVKI
jgi:hypothetical protein